MFRKKVYGQSRIEGCPFCGKSAVTENPQGVPVCAQHKGEEFGNMRCICGDPLDIMKGKFGAYFRCMRCGNVSFRKGLEVNPTLGRENKENKEKKQVNAPVQYKAEKQEKKEIIIRSDELDFYCG